MADFYDLLGVSRDADADTLKRSYRRLARQYHPDIMGQYDRPDHGHQQNKPSQLEEQKILIIKQQAQSRGIAYIIRRD